MAVSMISEHSATSRSLRDGSAFSLKLSASINQLLSRLVDIIAGTGRKSQPLIIHDLMSQDAGDVTIESPEGWEFAFEGGAHILFRYTRPDRRFVQTPDFLSLKGNYLRLC
jgi:hypothetical protein